MKKGILAFLILFLVITSCNNTSTNTKKSCCDTTNGNLKTNSNYQHLVGAVSWFQNSAEMKACYLQAYNCAQMALDKKLIVKNTTGKTPAVVVDIDETLLDNSPFETKCVETGKGYSKETWGAWTEKASAAALPGALDFLNYCKIKAVHVLYISNRGQSEKEATMKNLKNLGFPFVDDEHFMLKTESNSKELRREKAKEKYEIMLLIGDNLADLSQIFEADQRGNDMGFANVDKNKLKFGTDYIILPNPMYGEWEKGLFPKDKKLSDEEKGVYFTKSIKGY